MCTYSITVDEEAISKMRPSVSREAFGLLLQRYVDELVESFVNLSTNAPCNYTREEMMVICDQRMDDILSGRSITIPHEDVMQEMTQKYQLAI